MVPRRASIAADWIVNPRTSSGSEVEKETIGHEQMCVA